MQQTLKQNLRRMSESIKKRFQDVTNTPTTDKQTNNWPTILFEYMSLSDSNPGPLPSQAYSLPPV